jgi:toxin ParE1/3/4
LTALLSLDITARARRDLRRIARYTRNKWGEAQKLEYARKINAGLDTLSRYPDRGSDVPNRTDGMRRIPVAEHMVYFIVHEDAVEIVRILHQKMDPEGRI